jgi:hypothetical protein
LFRSSWPWHLAFLTVSFISVPVVTLPHLVLS